MKIKISMSWSLIRKGNRAGEGFGAPGTTEGGQPGKRRLKGELILHNSLPGGCCQRGLRLRSHGTRGNSFQLHHRAFNSDIRETFFIQRVTRPWHRLPRAVVEFPSLEGF